MAAKGTFVQCDCLWFSSAQPGRRCWATASNRRGRRRQTASTAAASGIWHATVATLRCRTGSVCVCRTCSSHSAAPRGSWTSSATSLRRSLTIRYGASASTKNQTDQQLHANPCSRSKSNRYHRSAKKTVTYNQLPRRLTKCYFLHLFRFVYIIQNMSPTISLICVLSVLHVLYLICTPLNIIIVIMYIIDHCTMHMYCGYMTAR